MEFNNENQTRGFASSIPLPSHRPQGKSLQDITTAANNYGASTASARGLPPPSITTRKYTGSSLNPPSPKRKTLVEQAGQTRPSSRSINHSSSRSLSSINNRQHSSSVSSVSSRTAAPSSRHPMERVPNVSAAAHARKPASGRPPARPQTSFGFAHSDRNSSSTCSSSRPVSSMDSRDADHSVNGNVLGKRKAWDESAKMDAINAMMSQFLTSYEGATNRGIQLTEVMEVYKSRIQELEAKQTELTDQNVNLRVDVDTMRHRVSAAEAQLQAASRDHEIAIDDLDRRHRMECESIRQEAKRQLDETLSQHQRELRDARRQLDETVAQHHEALREAKRQLDAAHSQQQNELREMRRRYDAELEEEKQSHRREIEQLQSQTSMHRQRGQMDVENKERELQTLRLELAQVRSELEQERRLNKGIQENLTIASGNNVALESSIRALKSRIEFLESGSKEQSDSFTRLTQQLSDALAETNLAKEKLRREETLRRKLHNQVQELKGNIRVFCRVRPLLPAEPAEDAARIQFPDEDCDGREISVQGPEERSSLGTVTTKTHAFEFDHVFGQTSQNSEVFEEISQLVQSALDGYNVCIFCYGQTGSGKTHTMSSEDGMITRAVNQIYDTVQALEERGWTYVMEGNFVEVYNENLNDLLGRAEELDKKKHEIRHDMQRCKTTITDITTVTLDTPTTVKSILRRAAANRSVAATKANERSSRSHSVFILKLVGENSTTGERCEGTLNLVDLAGSERLSQSGATGERLRETQNINRSLSCLGDVIGALGQGKEGSHIPYRNSKLTYLLQFSLGGNSKTLMFVNVSPRREHLGETLTSLKFATKVHNTHIGTARRQIRA